MRGSRTLMAVLLAAALVMCPVPASGATSSLEGATASVVAITVYADRVGSAVVVARDRVITAAHVVDGAEGAPSHVVAGDVILTYEVIAIDRVRDLALLAVDIPDDVPAIIWGDDAPLARGQDVIALGFPIGLRSVTLSKGVISAPAQVFDGATFIQTDAAINPGNSGGALVDAKGRLVGINVAKVASVDVDAVGFAVPAADVAEFLGRVAPDIDIERDLADDATAGESVPPGGGAALPVILIGAALAAVIAAGILLTSRRRAQARSEEPADQIPATAGRPRAVFRVTAPSGEAEYDVRLPAVAGTAPNADIAMGAHGASAYHIRFSAAAEGVAALDLTDSDGMYCGEACVRSAALHPGQSVRVGPATIVLVRTYEGARASNRKA